MRNNSNQIDFYTPTRQSYVAIVLILYKTYVRFVKNFWFVIIPYFIGKSDKSIFMLYGFIALAVLLGIYGIIAFFRYKFHVNSNEFIVEKGVFSRKKIVIPFDRIQSINFKQNIIQQIFSVVGLEIDTAGTSKKEFDFDALDLSTSNALRDFILSRKKQNQPAESHVEDSIVIEEEIVERTEEIIRLDIFDLIKVGISQNHFRSLFVGIFSIYWFLDQVDDAGFDVSNLTDVTEENILELGVIILGALMVVVFVAVIIISIVRNIVKYFDLTLYRVDNGFKLSYGLFNRNEVSVMDNKVQVISWTDNLLRKALGLFVLSVKLAAPDAIKKKKSIVIPAISKLNINRIRAFYYPNQGSEVTEFIHTNSYYFWRRVIIISIVMIVVGIGVYQFGEAEHLMVPVLIWIYFMLSSHFKFRKMKYGFNKEVLMVHSGIFGDKSSIYAIYKLQGVNISQTPIQKRKSLANVTVFSSAGRQTIRYIKLEEAQNLRDYVLFCVESDSRPWM